MKNLIVVLCLVHFVIAAHSEESHNEINILPLSEQILGYPNDVTIKKIIKNANFYKIILGIKYLIDPRLDGQELSYSLHKINSDEEIDYADHDTDKFKFKFPKQILSIYSLIKDDGNFHIYPAAAESPKEVTLDIAFNVLIQKDYGLEQKYTFYSLDNRRAISSLPRKNFSEKEDLVELFTIVAKINVIGENKTRNEVSFGLEKVLRNK